MVFAGNPEVVGGSTSGRKRDRVRLRGDQPVTREGCLSTLTAMPAQPQTRCVYARWDRPRYELLDRRGAVLEALSDLGDIAGFRPSPDAVHVDFAGGLHLGVDLGGITGVSPSSSPHDVYRPHVEAVAVVLGASRAAVRVALQHLVPWEGVEDPQEAQALAALRTAGLASATDCAVLVDGAVGEWTYNAEFGVVGADEVRDRLARLRGRAPGPKINTGLDDLRPPPVSTFVDSHWKVRGLHDVMQSETWGLVGEPDGLSATMVESLHTHLTQLREERLRDGA